MGKSLSRDVSRWTALYQIVKAIDAEVFRQPVANGV
jgi:hypothetical protein